MWLITLLDTLLGLDLVRHGVYPRELGGLSGVLWAPLIHGSISHMFANTAPVVVLGTVLLYSYPRSARIVVPGVYLATGFAVWLFARSAYHIGASGLTFGVMFFIFVIGVLRWDRRAIAFSLLVFFLYGGMIWGILPGAPGISFESHLFGALAGTALAFLLKNTDPAPPTEKYSWEDEEGDFDDTDRDRW